MGIFLGKGSTYMYGAEEGSAQNSGDRPDQHPHPLLLPTHTQCQSLRSRNEQGPSGLRSIKSPGMPDLCRLQAFLNFYIGVKHVHVKST